MICSSLFCLQNETRNQTILDPSRARIYSAMCRTVLDKQDQLPSQQLLQLRNQQLPSISSIKFNSRQSSSNSTMINSEQPSSYRSKMHVKRFSDKISISDLRKIQTLKKIPILSTSSSVQRIEMDSQTSSIIDKLEGVQMEGKIGECLDENTGDGGKAEIFLPQPKHFLMKWKKI